MKSPTIEITPLVSAQLAITKPTFEFKYTYISVHSFKHMLEYSRVLPLKMYTKSGRNGSSKIVGYVAVAKSTCTYVRDATIHNLDVSIVSRYSDILHDIIKCKFTDF